MGSDYGVLVIGAGSAGLLAALTLGRYLRRVLVADGGPARNAAPPGVYGFFTRNGIRPAELLRLRREEIGICEEPITRLIGSVKGDLRCIEFINGDQLERAALFLHAPQHQRTPLAADLGARLTSKGAVWVDSRLHPSIPGLYAAGDTKPGTQQALLAAADGNHAAIVINESLMREECPK